MPVVYVAADVAGSEESPVYAIMQLNRALEKLRLPEGYAMERLVARQPFSTERFAMKWDGEWHITYEVFRPSRIPAEQIKQLVAVIRGFAKKQARPGSTALVVRRMTEVIGTSRSVAYIRRS